MEVFGVTLEAWQTIAQLASAVGTIAAAIVVWRYTVETQKLRKTAEAQLEVSGAQLEAAIAPVLLVYKELPGSMVLVRKLNREVGGRFAFSFSAYNAGQGTAVSARYTVRSTAPISNSRRRTGDYDLTAIPPRSALEIVVPLETEIWGDLDGDKIQSLDIEIELHYESTSGKKYRTFIGGQPKDLNEAKTVEYGPLAGAPSTA